MSAEIMTGGESAIHHSVAITGMIIEPNSLEDGEVGRDFWATSKRDANAPSYLVKSWDGRISHRQGNAYILISPTLGTKDEPRFVEVKMKRKKFIKMLDYEPKRKDFREIDASLNNTREFIKAHLAAELDHHPEMSTI